MHTRKKLWMNICPCLLDKVIARNKAVLAGKTKTTVLEAFDAHRQDGQTIPRPSHLSLSGLCGTKGEHYNTGAIIPTTCGVPALTSLSNFLLNIYFCTHWTLAPRRLQAAEKQDLCPHPCPRPTGQLGSADW